MFRGVFSFIFPWLTPHLHENKSSESTVLHAESILLEEFNYISVTLYQLKQERSQLFNVYLIIVGIVASGLGTIATLYPNATFKVGGITRQSTDALYLAILVLAFVGFFSFRSFIRLLHLDHKCRECMIALNRIKETYIAHMPEIKNAFLWRLSNIPETGHQGSSVFLTGFTVAILGSLSIALDTELILINLLGFGGTEHPSVCVGDNCVSTLSLIALPSIFILMCLLYGWHYRNWKKHITI